MDPRIISVNVGQPREVEWKGFLVSTGIFKEPVEGRVKLRRLNLDGDGQADLSVHGGPEKAVYAYASEHYHFWRRELGHDLIWGAFGENLTLTGVLEHKVHIGDRYRVGSAVLMVTQPRVPCFKLALKFGRDDIIERFLRSGRSGFYLSVVEKGEVGAGDSFEFAGRESRSLSITDVNRILTGENSSTELLERAATATALPLGWRMHFAKRLEN